MQAALCRQQAASDKNSAAAPGYYGGSAGVWVRRANLIYCYGRLHIPAARHIELDGIALFAKTITCQEVYPAGRSIQWNHSKE